MMSMASLAADAVPASPMAYRLLLKKLDDGLGSEDCHKLNFITADFGISKAKLDRVRQPTDLFDELEKQALIAADDVSLLVELMNLIHRKDLLKIIHLYCNTHYVKQLRRNRVSKYRLLLLEIADNVSSADLNCFKQACKDHVGRQAVSKLQNVYQLFSLLEERGVLDPADLTFLCQLLELAGNMQMVQKVRQYERQGSLPDNELVQLGSRVVSEWRKLGTYLGLQHHTLEAIDRDYRGSEDKARQMLLAWKCSLPCTEDAYGILSQSLELCHRHDLAEAVNDTARRHQHPVLVTRPQDQTVFHDVTYQPAVQSTHPSTVHTHTALPVSDRGLPDQILWDLAEQIVADWRKVGTFLKIEYTTLSSIDQDYHRSNEKAYNMLRKWRSQLDAGTNAIRQLALVLKAVGRVDLSEWLQGITSSSGPMAQQLECLGEQLTAQPMNVDPPTHSTTQAQQPASHVDAVPGHTACTAFRDVTEKLENMSVKHHQDVQESLPIRQPDPEIVGQGSVIRQATLPEYRMNRNPRGLCMIVNNMAFTGSLSSKPRPGSELDAGKLHNLFNMLHFRVDIKENVTSHDMFDWFKSVSSLDHSSFDCFACCILTHGKLGEVYGSDSKSLEIQNIVALFTGVSCRSLAGKPKLFFIQACQGIVEQEGVEPIETDEPVGLGAGLRKLLPNESDFLLSYATVPGYVSYRSKTKGSWYVNALVDQIMLLHNTTDMLNILTAVNNTLCDKDAQTKTGMWKQVSAPTFTLDRALYLRSLEI